MICRMEHINIITYIFALLLFFKSTVVKGFLIVSLFMNVTLGGSFLISVYKIQFQTSGVVTGKEVTVRKGPGQSYEPVYQQPLAEGNSFRLVESHNDWWKVELANGDQVWIQSSDAGII